jgi:fructose-1,6-bisphosphatase/inositol monophosphatase family enzyme
VLADVEDVKRIVVEAGRRALDVCGAVDCEFKADQSLVTRADREAEKFIEAELNALYPGYAFLGVEYGRRGRADAPLWCCDPIDGTTNYVYGLPHWCVSVGLIHEGVPQLGAVYVPRLNELFWAARGQGAFCNGVPVVATDRESLHVEDTICFTSNALKTLNIEAVAGRIRSLGSIAIELLYTARGNLTAAVGLREGIIDIAAALCVCFEAGCEFRYLTGEPVPVPWLLENLRTNRHFLYGPPRLLNHLQTVLRPR